MPFLSEEDRMKKNGERGESMPKNTRPGGVRENIRRKQRKRNARLLSMFILLLVVISIGLWISAVSARRNTAEYKDKESRVYAELQKEKLRAKKLDRETEGSTDQEYIEKIAREKLGLVGPNDIILKEESGPNANPTEATTTKKQD